MEVGRITQATRTLGKPSDWDEARDGPCHGLPVRIEVLDNGMARFTSAWLPTPPELEALAAGGAIHLAILGATHPPVQVTVGAPPDEPTAPWITERDGWLVEHAEKILDVLDMVRPFVGSLTLHRERNLARLDAIREMVARYADLVKRHG